MRGNRLSPWTEYRADEQKPEDKELAGPEDGPDKAGENREGSASP